MHFFIDHTKLPVQGSNHKKFGPDPTNATTTFNLTTEFQLTQEAKAYACQAGMMVVQRSDANPTSLVNLIIKPLQPSNINGVTVRYFVYRGIKLSSFFSISGDTVSVNVENAATNTQFITAFWRNRRALSSTNPPAPTPLNFGYGHNDLPLSDPNNLNEDRPIRDIFNGKAPAKAYPVTEGMWIGDFSQASIAFEIELETELLLTSTLKTYRGASIVFQTDGLTLLPLKRRKEMILSFIDPAAFFGMHGDIGVSTTTYTGTSRNPSVAKTYSSGLYADIVSKFANRNRIYLDIRSEKGLSYNFYNTYKIGSGDLRNIVLHEGVDETTISELNDAAEPYERDGWPIVFFDVIKNHNTTRNKIRFRLRLDGNTDPVIFLENKKFSSISNNDQVSFYKDGAIKDVQTVWTKPITLYFRHAGSTATSNTPANSNVANYIKIFYFVGSTVPAGEARLANEKYYDSAFCSIDLESLADTNIPNGYSQNPSPIYIKEKLHEENGTGNFSFAAQTGAYWNSQGILFFAKAHNKINGSGKRYLNTYKRRLSFKNSRFFADLREDFYIVKKRYQTATGILDILGLNAYRKAGAYQEKEDLMLLGLSIAQIQQLKSTPGLSPHHPRYIFLERDHPDHLTDISSRHLRYFRYAVKIQGVDAGGVPQIVTPLPVINVFSRDNVFFSSTAFAPAEPLTLGENRIEFRIYRDGAIYINDNIDLSLVRKKVVDTLTDVNNVPVYTLIDDSAITADTSQAQDITYLFYDQDAVGALTPPVNPPAFCSLQIVMTDERILATPTPQELAAVTPADFTALNYDEIFNYTPFNDIDVWAQRSYQHDDTGDVITRGRTGTDNLGNPVIANRKYLKLNRKVFMVFVDDALVNASTLINNRFSWEATVRHFARPDLFAVFLAALREINDSVVCQGFAYPDASSFPSVLHVNGNAFDTNYFLDMGGNINDDIDFIQSIHRYGTGRFRIGPDKAALRTALNPTPDDPNGINWTEGGKLHNTHLHTEDIKIHK